LFVAEPLPDFGPLKTGLGRITHEKIFSHSDVVLTLSRKIDPVPEDVSGLNERDLAKSKLL
jgi:hypothetical protein